MSEAGPPVAEEIHVWLTYEAAIALASLMEMEGLRRVDVVNRAIKVYAFIAAVQRAGGLIMYRQTVKSRRFLGVEFSRYQVGKIAFDNDDD